MYRTLIIFYSKTPNVIIHLPKPSKKKKKKNKSILEPNVFEPCIKMDRPERSMFQIEMGLKSHNIGVCE